VGKEEVRNGLRRNHKHASDPVRLERLVETTTKAEKIWGWAEGDVSVVTGSVMVLKRVNRVFSPRSCLSV
jgi:hypothetical protein